MISRLRSGMMLRIHALQPIQRYVRINLRRRDIRMAENGLHRAEIGSVLDHVRRARVPKHVRTGAASGRQHSDSSFPNQLPDALTR